MLPDIALLEPEAPTELNPATEELDAETPSTIPPDGIVVYEESISCPDCPVLSRSWYHGKLGLKLDRPPIRSSARTCFRRCPRRFMWEYRLGLHLKGQYRSALATGIHLHDLLEAVYREGTGANLPRLLQERLAEGEKTLTGAADPETGLLPTGKTLRDVLDKRAKDGALALALAVNFCRFCPPEALLRKFEIVDVERTVAVRVPGIGVPLVAKADLLLQERDSGDYWIVDHKTTSYSALTRAASLPFSWQARFYKWVIWADLAGRRRNGEPIPRIGGFIHNVIRKPSIRQKKTETHEEYIERVNQWYVEQATLDPNDPPIFSSVVPQVGPMMTRDLSREIRSLDRASSGYLDLGVFWQDEDACMGRFGNEPCPYLRLCRTDHNLDRWPEIIRADYEQSFRDWKSDLQTGGDPDDGQ